MNKMIYGLAIAAMAVGVSAFTNKPLTLDPGDLYGNTASGTYTEIPSYDPTKCQNTESVACGYRELPAGQGIVSAPFGATQAQQWEAQGYIERISDDEGVYLQ